MPFSSAAAATRRSADTASQGYSTVECGTARIIARSSSPICEGPSSPIDTPQCEPTYLMVTPEIPAMRMWSKARVKNAAKVETNGILPHVARPTAAPTMFCSAI